MRKIIIAVAAALVLWAGQAGAVPKGKFVNPITEVAWHEVLPIKIAGVKVGGADNYDSPDAAGVPVCACPMPPPLFFRIGLPVSFWSPERVAEAPLKDAFFFPSLGINLGISGFGADAMSSSTSSAGTNRQDTFGQAHWLIFPVWAVMGLLEDMGCLKPGGIDVAMITEILPTWQDDSVAAILTPEVLLFSNPVAQIACTVDAISTNLWGPIPFLFWCIGSQSAYPMNGHVSDFNNIQGANVIASRFIYNLSRMMMVWDQSLNLCAPVPTPIWYKNSFKLQLLRPVPKTAKAFPIGTSAWKFQSLANPPTGGDGTAPDNWAWLVFKKTACCLF